MRNLNSNFNSNSQNSQLNIDDLKASLDDCERKLNRLYEVLSDESLVRAFSLFHSEGNHEAARPFLAELLRRLVSNG